MRRLGRRSGGVGTSGLSLCFPQTSLLFFSLASSNTKTRHLETMTSNDPSSTYKPSPYSPIIPRVQLSKPRPKLVQTVDVPPVPASFVEKVDEVVVDVAADGDADEALRGSASHPNDSIKATNDVDIPHVSEDGVGAESSDDAFNKGTDDDTKTLTPVSTRRNRRMDKAIINDKVQFTKTETTMKLIEVVDTTDAQYNLQSKDKANIALEQEHQVTCSTCNKNVARYVCPKCTAPYCSVPCYRIHDGSEVSSDVYLNAGLCTESFYKDRVLNEYHSLGSTSGELSKLHEILTRLHRDINDKLDDVESREESVSRLLHQSDGETGVVGTMQPDLQPHSSTYHSSALRLDSSSAAMSDEDLAELASYVLYMEDGEYDEYDDEVHGKRLLESIPPHLLHAFETALASATVATDISGEDTHLAEKIWGPFAEPNDTESPAQSSNNTTRKLWWLTSKNSPSGSENDLMTTPTLDEKILSLKPLPKLANHETNQKLAFNILDVIFATAFSMRSSSSTAQCTDYIVDTAAVLISQSVVLSEDARYGSVREAMTSCTKQLIEVKRSICGYKTITSLISWETLASDVASLSFHRRAVLRVLFDASDILHKGIEDMKRELKLIKQNKHDDKAKQGYDDIKRQYKLATKKVEYFLSWCSSMWTAELGKELSEEVNMFVEDWRSPEVEAEESNLESLLRIDVPADDSSAAFTPNFLGLELGGNKSPSFGMKSEFMSVSTTRKKET